MGLKYKLYSIVGVLLVLGIMSTSVFYISKTQNINMNEQKLAEKQKEHTQKVNYNISQVQQFITDASLTGDEASITEANEHLAEIKKSLEILSAQGLAEEVNKFNFSLSEFNKVGFEMFDGYKKSKEIGNAIMKRAETGFDAISEELQKVIMDLSQKAEARSAEINTRMYEFQNRIYYVSLISLFLAIAVIIYVVALSKSLSTQLMNVTMSVATSSNQIMVATKDISEGSGKLADEAQKQAASVEKTSSSLTEISGMSNSNSQISHSAAGSAKEVLEITQNTASSMHKLTSAVDEILKSNEKISQLSKIVEEIGEKTKIIDDIVFKTQLLSFNASVEAERAGEYGRGFSVVAQEVGNLAQLSGQAASEISTIVLNSIREANSVVEENKQKVTEGGRLAQTTQTQLELVLSKLSEVLDAIDKISHASKEQSLGVDQIASALDHINQSSQGTSGAATQSASAAVELTSQAESLNQLVDDLKRIIHG